MKCISNHASIRFIDQVLRKNLHLNIIEFTRRDDDYLRYDQPVFRTKQLADKIMNAVQSATVFPVFIPLNIICDVNCFKHAQLIIITKNDNKYGLLFFDPNGLLSVYNKDGTTKDDDHSVYHYHTAIILNVLAEALLSTKKSSFASETKQGRTTRSSKTTESMNWISTRPFEVNTKILNPEGHCDAITLWYIYMNKDSKTVEQFKRQTEVLQELLGYHGKKIDMKRMLQQTRIINESIVKMTK